MESLTKNEAYAIAELIDMTLLQTIREDQDIDSLQWLKNVINGYEKLCEFSGYEGVTESNYEEEEEV